MNSQSRSSPLDIAFLINRFLGTLGLIITVVAVLISGYSTIRKKE